MSEERPASPTAGKGGAAHHADMPSPWIRRFAHLVGAGAKVLDIAAGHGRHARYFAGRGANVLAVDRDALALATLNGVAGVTARVADLENGEWPFLHESFDAVVVVNYLHRALFPHILDALAPDGTLLYETFAVGNEQFGRPANPAFLLRENELIDLTERQLRLIAFEQGRHDDARVSVVQRLAAVGRAHRWPAPIESARD